MFGFQFPLPSYEWKNIGTFFGPKKQSIRKSPREIRDRNNNRGKSVNDGPENETNVDCVVRISVSQMKSRSLDSIDRLISELSVSTSLFEKDIAEDFLLFSHYNSSGMILDTNYNPNCVFGPESQDILYFHISAYSEICVDVL